MKYLIIWLMLGVGLTGMALDVSPLPAHRVTLLSEQSSAKGDVKNITAGAGAAKTTFAALAGTQVEITFDRPAVLGKLAVIRYGYKDWAVPREMTFAADTRPELAVTLDSPRVPPHLNGKDVDASIVDLGEEPVSKLVITVKSVDSLDQNSIKHGILQLGKVGSPAPAAIPAAEAASEDDHALTYQLLPLTGFKATAVGKAVTKQDVQNVGANSLEASPVWNDLAQMAVKLEFDTPADLSKLAVLRVGWQDWASASEVGIRVNGKPEQLFLLKSKIILPNSQKAAYAADILILADAGQVKTLEIAVKKVAAKGNLHGSIKLAIPGEAAKTQWVDNDSFAKAGKIKLTVKAKSDLGDAVLRANAYRFRSDIVWELPLVNIKAGDHEFVLDWPMFVSRDNPGIALTPWNVSSFELAAASPAPFEFTVTPLAGREAVSLWDKVGLPDNRPDADGFRPGIPANGFGRFGYMPANGLLTCNVEGNGLFFQVYDRTASAFFKLNVGSGPAQRTIWQRREVNASSVVLTRLKSYLDAKESQVTSKAYGIFDQTKVPERWIYSILAPGVLTDSSDRIFSLTPEVAQGAAYVLYPGTAGKLVFQKVTGKLALDDLSEGWLVIVWEKTPAIPVMLALEKKPQAVMEDKGEIALLFDQARGMIGIGGPNGIRPWAGNLGEINAAADTLAGKARFLAGVLRAYPLTVNMSYQLAGDSVNFCEIFGRVNWKNAWRESPNVIYPVPPLIAFAKEMHYPVAFDPAQTPVNSGIDTKYGPYSYFTQPFTYALPVPPKDRIWYPADLQNPLVAKVAANVAKHLDDGRSPEKLRRSDALSCWWMYGSAALAWPSYTSEQKQTILTGWKRMAEYSLSDRAWYLRREPFTGLEYPMSFAWMDKSLQVLGDPNTGIGAALSGLWAYAATSGDWQLIGDNWDKIRKISRYYYLSHDWTTLQTGCREHTASSAIDMDVISYDGVCGYYHLAKELGRTDDMSDALMLLSRLAVSNSMKWHAADWRSPGLPLKEQNSVGIGFNDKFGFESMAARGKDPNYINSEVALSLAWIGHFPTFYSMLLFGNLPEYWQFFEYDYVENKLDNWRKQHPGSRNWHDANLTAHLYLRRLLGESKESIDREMADLKNNKGDSFLLNPDPRMAAENAGFYALHSGVASPVRLLDNGQSVLQTFFAADNFKTVTLSLLSTKATVIKLELRQKPAPVTLNGKTITVNAGVVELPVAAGKSELVFHF